MLLNPDTPRWLQLEQLYSGSDKQLIMKTVDSTNMLVMCAKLYSFYQKQSGTRADICNTKKWLSGKISGLTVVQWSTFCIFHYKADLQKKQDHKIIYRTVTLQSLHESPNSQDFYRSHTASQCLGGLHGRAVWAAKREQKIWFNQHKRSLGPLTSRVEKLLSTHSLHSESAIFSGV